MIAKAFKELKDIINDYLSRLYKNPITADQGVQLTHIVKTDGTTDIPPKRVFATENTPKLASLIKKLIIEII